MFVASREDDGAGFIADEALGDESGAKVVGRGGSPFVQDGVGRQHLRHQGVTVGSRFQLIHFREYRFSLRRFLHNTTPFLLLIRRH